MPTKRTVSQPISTAYDDDDDDDFQVPLSQTPKFTTTISKKQKIPLKPSNNPSRPSKKPKPVTNLGKENNIEGFYLNSDETCSLEAIPSSIDCTRPTACVDVDHSPECEEIKEILKVNEGYLRNSVESRLLRPRAADCSLSEESEEEEEDAELDVLLKLCDKNDVNCNKIDESVRCPLCGIDMSDLNEELRQAHTNNCLDKCENQAQDVVFPRHERGPRLEPEIDLGLGRSPQKAVDVSPVVEFLHSLGLARYEEAFVREEIDWDTLQWLTEEDLIGIGVTALGPRKKILHTLCEIKKEYSLAVESNKDAHVSDDGSERHKEASKVIVDGSSKPAANKLITDFFLGSITNVKKVSTPTNGQSGSRKSFSGSDRKKHAAKDQSKGRKHKDIPTWCCVPGTPFRVDAFKYLRGDCSHWFLTHFHMDHYQGLTRSFHHGKIYCSLITARLVNMKIGIPWDRLQVLPLNQKTTIAGIDVTCLEANHCPGSIIILFEPQNGKAVLHTGDFRFSEEMASMSVLQTCPIHTLILDTTYCNPLYDFPKQEAVIQFVIEAIQAESFNPKTLFLIGSYTIGKERLFLEVARVLRKKIYVNAAKFRVLKCLDFSKEDIQWFTTNEHESHIHVMPMWTLASFKRLKHMSNQYAGRFSLIVAFSPTGWTFSKGKKKSSGRRWQQGTIIRYEVPYSEHCSFTELKEFVKFVSPEHIIPSVNNDGRDSANAMVSLLLN